MSLDQSRHPCFNEGARHRYGRIHLPVAPKCNIQCNFCNRKYACALENRPGVTAAVLTPEAALRRLDEAVAQDPRLAVLGIAGPGDPFANPVETMATLRGARERYPEMLLCVATNGLEVEPYAEELAALQTSHVSVTINAVDPAIGERIYAWVRIGKTILRGRAAAEALLERQLAALAALKRHGLTVKVNTIVIPGVNDEHVEEVARVIRAAGTDLMNLMPLYPVAGTPLGETLAPAAERMTELRTTVEPLLPQMSHCVRCRADAIGMLDEAEVNSLALIRPEAEAPTDRPYVAVASLEGILVNQHLGEADRFWVFGPDEHRFKLVEMRKAPPPGAGKERWLQLANVLRDCRAVLVGGAGQSPREVLEPLGLKVVDMEGLIEEALRSVYRGQEIRSPIRRRRACGEGCGGTGLGCG